MNLNLRKKILLGAILLSLLPLIGVRVPRIDLSDMDGLLAAIKFVGSILGLAGVILLWWQFLLGWRRFVPRLVVDLIWTNRIHKLLGKYGVLLIFLHPLLIIIGYGAASNLIMRLSFVSQFDIYLNVGKLAIVILTTIWIASALFRRRLTFRTWKFIHLFSYFVLPLVLLHGYNIGTQLAISPALQLYWKFLAASTVAIIIFRIGSQLGLVRRRYRVKKVAKPTHNVTELTLSPIGGWIKPAPGQFVYLQTQLLGENHPFSAAGFDTTTGEITLAIKDSGKFSGKVDELKLGQQVWLDGPYGVFTREVATSHRKSIFIVGGIGITPFLRWVDDRPSEITLFYANKAAADIAYRAELEVRLGPNLVHILNTQPEDKQDFTNLEIGFFGAEILRKYVTTDLAEFEYFVCGPPPMMNAVLKILNECGIPAAQVHMEKFSL